MLVDANIFLEVALGQDKADECQKFLDKIFEGKLEAFTTDFIIDSVIIVMEFKGATRKQMKEFLINLLASKGLTIFSLDFMDKIVAIELSKDLGIDFEDSLILVAMKALKIKNLVSFDSDFDKIAWVKRGTPDKFL